MGVEQTTAPEFTFTCDACDAETATADMGTPPDGWHQLTTGGGAQTAMIGPNCSAAGITVVYAEDSWQIARST
jgi:hypothetical protein